MIVYAFFVILIWIAIGLYMYGMYVEMTFWSWLGPELGSPGFLPESFGWYLIAFFMMFFVIIALFVRIKWSGCGKRFDKHPREKALFNYLYRDGLSVDMIGERRAGLGAFDVPETGVIVDIGRLPSPGSVYRHSDKNIRFALQDINFTPNPLFTSIYSFFTYLGFNDMDDVQDVLNGYNPTLMVKIWNKLCEHKLESAEDKLIDNIKKMDKREKRINNAKWKKEQKKLEKKVEKKKRPPYKVSIEKEQIQKVTGELPEPEKKEDEVVFEVVKETVPEPTVKEEVADEMVDSSESSKSSESIEEIDKFLDKKDEGESEITESIEEKTDKKLKDYLK
jgi:hypothetical protein